MDHFLQFYIRKFEHFSQNGFSIGVILVFLYKKIGLPNTESSFYGLEKSTVFTLQQSFDRSQSKWLQFATCIDFFVSTKDGIN